MSSEKFKPFENNLEPTIPNSVLVQKSFSSLYSNFILNLYIVYGLDTWPRNPVTNFTLKTCLFGTVKITKNAGKSKCIHNVQEIAIDGKDYWSFENDIARNVISFGVDNSSPSHIDNPKNKFLALGKGPTEGINESVGAVEK